MGDFIQVNISNSLNDSVCFEKKFPKDMNIGVLKTKLEIITGGNAASMELQLFSGDRLITLLSDNDAIIGDLPIENNMRLHVVDRNAVFIGDNVEKFELSKDEYDQRRNTVKNYLKTNRLGKYNEEEMKVLEEKRIQEAKEQQELSDGINIGDRCLVTAKGPRRIGTVLYKGELDGKPGIFLGVRFDEPLGLHNGTVNGRQYFECPPKYGSMIPITSVEIGDFPPESDGLDDDEI